VRSRILLSALERDTDILQVRKRTRRLAELFGFDVQDQTRITTAVSEIARNALEYGKGGRVEWRIRTGLPNQIFEIVVSDKGPGIADLDDVLSGTRRSTTGLGVGLIGARRLMEHFEIECKPGGGTTVRLGKPRPARAALIGAADLQAITDTLAKDEPADPVAEIRRQNQEIMMQLAELQDRKDELSRLNQELQDTNRGVVALYAELDERADHLRRADELKSKFLSNMSHEFRTPLNSILALSRLLLSGTDGNLGVEQGKQVQFIRKAAESLTELVDDLLDLARVEAGKTVVAPIEFSVASLFGALRGMLRPLLVGDAVALVFDDAADLPILFTDEGKLSQILRNFISNAIKFTEHGEVRIRARFDAAADAVTIEVSDTGIGIAEQDLEVIFQEFGQIAHPLQTRVKGTGLGLPLARKLAELLGGTVAVESVLGRGSTFAVTLPRHYRIEGMEEQPEEEWQVDPNRVPVLLVEDSPADAFALDRMLVSSRYQVLRVASVAAARRALERLTPSAILLDVVLAGEETWRLIMELKQSEQAGNIPLMVASSTGDERKALSLGVDHYLHKPIKREELVDLLDRITGHRSVTRILMIDDEEVSRYLVRQLLPRGLYHIDEAATGMEGLARLQDGRPDLVLLDLNMPGMDGFEFLKRFAAENGRVPIPALVLTSAVLGEEDRNRLGRFAPVISKSDLSAATLIGAIESLLTPSERARP